MKSSLPVVAMALTLCVFARTGLSQQYGFAPPGQPGYAQPGGYGPGAYYPGMEPSSMMAPSPYAPSPYSSSFGIAPAGFQPDMPADAYAGPPPEAMNGYPQYEGEPSYEGAINEGSGDGYIGGDCESCGGAGCGDCGFGPRIWGGLLYFANWRDDRNLPPLVTTSPVGTPFAQAGLLPDATILVGGDVGGEEVRSGAKAFAGIWLDELHEVALAGSAWAVEADPEAFFFASNGAPGSLIIAQPFESTLTNAQSRAIVAFPGFSSGSVRVVSKQFNTYGGDLYLQTNWTRTPCASVDLIGGYVTARMDDLVSINADRTSIPPNGPPPFGATLSFHESFRTQNEFHGGELGITSQLQSLDQRWTFNVTGKCGFGGMTQRLRIRGTTVTQAGGVVVVTPGGLYTQPTNIGDFEQTKFAVAPEVEMRMTNWVTPHIGLSVGYQFYYWSSVALAGDQIDTTVNPTQFGGGVLVGEARPRARFNPADYWIQGLTVGIVGQF
jgi:hypothetical protein